jgi:hypothetical protein
MKFEIFYVIKILSAWLNIIDWMHFVRTLTMWSFTFMTHTRLHAVVLTHWICLYYSYGMMNYDVIRLLLRELVLYNKCLIVKCLAVPWLLDNHTRYKQFLHNLSECQLSLSLSFFIYFFYFFLTSFLSVLISKSRSFYSFFISTFLRLLFLFRLLWLFLSLSHFLFLSSVFLPFFASFIFSFSPYFFLRYSGSAARHVTEARVVTDRSVVHMSVVHMACDQT